MRAELAMVQGRLPAKLAEGVSDAIYEALQAGMKADEAASIAITVAVEYAAEIVGPVYAASLSEFVTHLASKKAKDGAAVRQQREGGR